MTQPIRSNRFGARTCMAVQGGLLAVCTMGQPGGHIAGLPLPQPGAYLQYGIEADFQLPEGVHLPKHVDLSAHLPRVGDQGRYASCTAWAIGYGVMTYDRNLRQSIKPDKSRAAEASTVFSPGYLFSMVKNYVQPDTSPRACYHGVDMEATFTIACQWGNVRMNACGADRAGGGCLDTVGLHTMNAALYHKLRMPVSMYHKRLKGTGASEIPFDPAQWKYHLALGEPILTGLFIDCSFTHGGDLARAPGVPFVWDQLSPADDDCSGGHALVCCGYDDADSTFLFYNSFGTAWGDSGYCRITYPALYANCTQAYIFSGVIDEQIKPHPAVLRHPSIVTDTTVAGKLKAGQNYLLAGTEVILAQHDTRGRHVRVDLSDPATHTLLRSIVVDEGVTRSVVYNDKLWIIHYTEPSWLSRLLGNKVRLSVEEDPDDDETLLRLCERHLERFRHR